MQLRRSKKTKENSLKKIAVNIPLFLILFSVPIFITLLTFVITWLLLDFVFWAGGIQIPLEYKAVSVSILSLASSLASRRSRSMPLASNESRAGYL